MKKPKAEPMPECVERNSGQLWRDLLNETGNPYYAWKGIQACTEERPFRRLPDWLVTYLAECAERMLSSKAKAAGDLGRVLPWVLGFPTRRGPGRYLDSDRVREQRCEFALVFALRLAEGDSPPLARHNACTRVFGDTDVDDRTLQRWLLKEFDLKGRPTIEEWNKAAKARFWWAFGIPPPRFWPFGEPPPTPKRTKSRETLS